jgi:hypothetical protein
MSGDYRPQDVSGIQLGDTPSTKSNRPHKSIMEIATYVVGLAVLILGLLSAAFFSVGHRDLGLWTTCAAIVLAVVGGGCWYQDLLWKRDKAAKKLAEPPMRARVLYVETRLILPTKAGEPVRVTFGLINTGNADATFTLKDRTYFFSLDPTQTVFKYQPTPSEEMRISAIPNAVWRAEMRFDLDLPPDKLEALNTGNARLFFYARGEYRDAAGEMHSLPFAEMYDASFPGNLIAPPKNIVFQ